MLVTPAIAAPFRGCARWWTLVRTGRIPRVAQQQRVALVTGASRGIGAAIARRIAGSGVAVVLAARTIGACERIAGEIRAGGGRASSVELDVADAASIAAAARKASEPFGAIDWLVNNAGIAISAPLLGNDELYERHMLVNFHGARRVIEALLPAMKSRGYGRIVNVASSAALHGYRYVAAYSASKHALLGYTRCAALELEGSGVAISALCPHYVDSPMTDDAVKRVTQKTGKSESEARAWFAAQNPSGRLLTLDEVAASALELLERGANGAIRELGA
jgi:NAD(P)-dependent dehydrogenase (short-subunit alcohol dehydrogenase family)